MCGINGIINLKDQNQYKVTDIVQAMNTAINHRGPDSDQIIENAHLCFGNLRLSQKDPHPRSHLPFANSDKSIIMAFNGEIYNFKELEQKFNLRDKYSFKGNSDSEVLFYLYQEIGLKCLEEITGMFSIAIFDQKLNKVFLVRDFYGMIPLFYSQKDSNFIFSSEIKGILEYPEISLDLDEQAIYDLFTLAYIPHDQTPFKSIKELLPGHYLDIDLNTGSQKLHQYYSAKPEQKIHHNETKIIKDTEELFLETVRQYVDNDEPIGMMLSGGLDTSCLLVALKKLGLSKDFPTFSLQIQNPHFNESKYQEIMNQYANSKPHYIKVSQKEVLDSFSEHLAFIDEPYGHGAAIPTFLLAKTARKSVKAILSGEGGDEIFNGYETHGAMKYRKLYLKTPKSLRKLNLKIINNLPTSHEKLSLDFLLKRFSTGCELSTPKSHVFWRHVLTDEAKNKIILKGEELLDSSRFYVNIHNQLGEKNIDDVDFLSLADTNQFFFGDLMVKNDRMVYANSVESRFPFMDRKFFEHVLSVPTDIRYKGIKRRHLQKSLFFSEMPNQIRKRSGFGLELPYNQWLHQDFSQFSQVINQENVQKLGLFNWSSVEEIIQKHLKKEGDYGRFIWCLYILICWHQMFVVDKTHKKIRQKYREILNN